MLAFMPYKQRMDILDSLVPDEEKAAFLKELKITEQNGYAISHGERTEGTSSVAAPILNHFGKVHGAVSIGFVSFNLTDERLHYLIKNVVETGKRISEKLGHKGF